VRHAGRVGLRRVLLVAAAVAAGSGATLATPVPASAQHVCLGSSCTETQPGEPPFARRDQHMLNVAVNGIVTGLTTGAAQRRRGGTFSEGFVRGWIGGAVAYSGKVIAVQEWGSSGVLGRGVAAAGSSISANAAAGRPAFERLVLPLGPLRFDLRPGAPRQSTWRVDALGIVGLGLALYHYDGSLDWDRTLAYGTPVFFVEDLPRHRSWGGRQIAGVVLINEQQRRAGPQVLEMTLGHEMVHVLQYDQAFTLWSRPVEEHVFGGRSWTLGLERRVDLSLTGLVGALLMAIIPYEQQPWEMEAHFLAESH
jgi:hypothetical protein